MCGIVGVLGKGPVAEQLVDALKRLEYRGYNSAGVATVENGHLGRRRAEGKLRNLEELLKRDRRFTGDTGIGHTRWATHGKPIEANAHPHMTELVSVVHNGIIENFRELKEELAAQGAAFTSDTDTEVIAHLITRELKAGSDPVRAVYNTLEAPRRRVCARHDLPRLQRSDDRGAPGQPARHRLRQRRDVRGLRCDRARALHRCHRLSRGRRLGGADAARASPSATATARRSSGRSPARSPPRSSSTRATTATSWPRRSTSSRK